MGMLLVLKVFGHKLKCWTDFKFDLMMVPDENSVHPEEGVNVWTKFNGDPSNSCGDFSPKTINVNLMDALEERSGDQQSQTDSSSGHCEWWHKISYQISPRLRRYCRLDQSGGLTKQQADSTVHRAASVATDAKKSFKMWIFLGFLCLLLHDTESLWVLDSWLDKKRQFECQLWFW